MCITSKFFQINLKVIKQGFSLYESFYLLINRKIEKNKVVREDDNSVE